MRLSILALALAAIIACPTMVLSEDAPDLTGTWQVITSEWRSEIMGVNVDKPQSFRFVVTGQKRKIFWGTRTFWDQDAQTARTVPFSGIIAIDNKNLYIKEHGDSIAHGDIVGADKMYLYFLGNSKNAKVLLWEAVRMK